LETLLRNIRLTIQYDGTGFLGWQRQARGPTVQEELEKALSVMTGETVSVIGSGRTDAGVHALGQVANFKTKSNIPLSGLVKGLNSLLPRQIAVTEALEVPLEFHAIRDAVAKEYEYRIISAKTRQPLWENRAWVITRPLDLEGMQAAATHLTGTHDFSSFMASGSQVKTTVRTIHTLEVSCSIDECFPPVKGQHYQITVAADGFLRYMVRNITGILVEVGLGKRDPDAVRHVLKATDRCRAGPTAPAQGLYLMRVMYK